jgi:hypothetical protein
VQFARYPATDFFSSFALEKACLLTQRTFLREMIVINCRGVRINFWRRFCAAAASGLKSGQLSDVLAAQSVAAVYAGASA